MLPELPTGYYLDNVLTLLRHVRGVYGDILDPQQLDFLERFDALDADAQKLYVRLLNRNGIWFRADKLVYPEIGDLDAAIENLERQGCLSRDAEIETDELLSLFTRPELLNALGRPPELMRLRRRELDELLREDAWAEFRTTLRGEHSLLMVLRQDEYQLCQMLFFGNLNQSMTDFVLRDLGLYRFEDYPVDPAHRPYRSQLEILQHWLLYQLDLLYRLTPPDDSAALADICAEIPGDIDADAPAWRKAGRLRHEIARQLERNGEFDTALEIYRACPLPPSRERMARIQAGRDQVEAALAICAEILADPIDETESQFAASFSLRLARRHGLTAPAGAKRQLMNHRPEILDLELERQPSVELAVAEYFDAEDGEPSCYYVENSLFNGMLGLLLWDVVFAPVSGAFYNPFQHRPSDFYTPEFTRRRADLLACTWERVRSTDDIRETVLRRWDEKHGVMNPLVNWTALDPGLLERALERVPFAHWRAVFAQILRDLRNHRAGFPDLIRFPPGGGYELIEVKGPGDALQKNQRRWMHCFRQHAIPHRLARVQWQQN